MQPRPANPDDAEEMVRLAGLLFDSMGQDTSGPEWREASRRRARATLGQETAGFVVDHPDQPARLVASVAGTLVHRLPTPLNPAGAVGYVQWVYTDPEFRGHGLARQAMAALLAWYDEQDVRTVELHATAMAESMYIGLGFDDSGPRALRRRRN